MASYLTVTSTTRKYLEALPVFDEAYLEINALRARPELKSPAVFPVVNVETMSVPGTPDLSVDVYRPSDSKDRVLPALIYIHGGGWALHSNKDAYRFLCSKIADTVKCAVFYVHYTLSPEAQFPIAVEECYSVFSWVTGLEHCGTLKIDPTRVAIGGDSAGGNLAIAVTLLDKERNEKRKLVYQVLFYPVTDAVFNTGSYYEFGKDFGLVRRMMEYFWDLYVPDKTDRQNILACPLKATLDELKDLPPALIITAEADILRDEAEIFARKLIQAGVPVTSTRVLGVLHGFMTNSLLYSEETLSSLDMAMGALCRCFA
ncbi:hypothetical protein INT47_000733 [Mucor saturninus]|uniref:Alpha/beta hydrolase fold-3 domain-containing protein n=1 Tax=Mucor saturninus TaxID=64648 RepID=A0A8H7UYI0_9FUNG|nr:hypothetical protein INT47_000733 [Mucor saturninus]